MNPSKLGDSYDIVKRFFCDVLREQGYDVFIDPMFSGNWDDSKKQLFYKFLGVENVSEQAVSGYKPRQKPTAIVVDPDTGVSEHDGKKHVSFGKIADLCGEHGIVLVFDQSFRRCSSHEREKQMKRKLRNLSRLKRTVLYHKSHACFLFASCSSKSICHLRDRLLDLGLPENRLVMLSRA